MASRKVVGVAIGVIVAIVVIASVLLLFQHRGPTPPSYASLVEAARYAKYEALYDLHLRVTVMQNLPFMKRNVTVLVGGFLTIGQDTSNRTYVYGTLSVTAVPGGGVSYTVTLPLEAAYVIQDSKATTCLNITVTMLGKIRFARCNTTRITSKYVRMLELARKIALQGQLHAKYIGTEEIAGVKSYCYTTWFTLNLTKYIMRRPMVIPYAGSMVYNVTIGKICYTSGGVLTKLTADIVPITKNAPVLVEMKINLIAKKVRPGYFNEKFLEKLLKLPTGPLASTLPLTKR